MVTNLRPVGLTPSERPDTVDLVDFIAEAHSESHDWIVEGLAERGGRIMLTGGEGAGKSLAGLTMAVQASAGLPVWGQFKTDVPARVVYFDLEMNRRSLWRRAKSLMAKAKLMGGFIEPGHFRLVTKPDGVNLSSSRSQDTVTLLDEIRRYRPDLVFFDPLYKAINTDAATETEMRPFLRFMDTLRKSTGCGLVLLHHLRKGNGISERGSTMSDTYGSSILLRWPEVVLSLGGTPMELRVLKDRECYFEDTLIYPVQKGGEWLFGVTEHDPIRDLQERIMDRLRMEGARSATSLYKDLGGRKDDTLAALRDLEASGAVTRLGTGKTTRWMIDGTNGEVIPLIQRAFADDPETEETE